MKKILFLLISLILIGCGTRTKKTEKTKTETSSSATVSKTENVDFKNSAESKTDLSQYLKESGLKINSTGKPYTLQYNGVVFSGDANLEFSDKEEKLMVKTITKQQLIYKSKTTYKSSTHHKTIYHKKTMDLKSERSSWWLFVLLYFAGLSTIPLIKYFIKK